METNSTQITKIKRDQIKGQLDKVHYTICTHYFYPEDHELIVNLHRLGKIEVSLVNLSLSLISFQLDLFQQGKINPV